MPERFFSREQALSLDESAFDLAVVDRRIDAATNIHFDIGAQTGPIARQSVDFDFRGCNALREVVEHLPGVGTPDVADVGGFVEAVCGEIDAVEVGGVRKIVHGGFDAEFGAVGGEAGV